MLLKMLLFFVAYAYAYNATLMREIFIAFGCNSQSERCVNTTCPPTLDSFLNGRLACDSFGDVVHLDIGDEQLTGSIPTTIALLSKLTYINLFGNDLTGTLDLLSPLTNLNALLAGVTKMTGGIPPSISRLSLVEKIGLYGVLTFDGTISTEIGLLTKLSYLEGSYSGLVGTIPTELGQLTGLTELKFDQAKLTGTVPSEINNLRQLTALSFGNNNITGTLPTFDMPGLTRCYFTSTCLDLTSPLCVSMKCSCDHTRFTCPNIMATSRSSKTTTQTTTTSKVITANSIATTVSASLFSGTSLLTSSPSLLTSSSSSSSSLTSSPKITTTTDTQLFTSSSMISKSPTSISSSSSSSATIAAIDNEPQSNLLPIIIGCVVGGVVLIAIIVIIVIFTLKRKDKSPSSSNATTTSKTTTATTSPTIEFNGKIANHLQQSDYAAISLGSAQTLTSSFSSPPASDGSDYGVLPNSKPNDEYVVGNIQ